MAEKRIVNDKKSIITLSISDADKILCFIINIFSKNEFFFESVKNQ